MPPARGQFTAKADCPEQYGTCYVYALKSGEAPAKIKVTTGQLADTVRSFAGPAATELKTEEDLSEFLKANPKAAVGFFKDAQAEEHAFFISMARELSQAPHKVRTRGAGMRRHGWDGTGRVHACAQRSCAHALDARGSPHTTRARARGGARASRLTPPCATRCLVVQKPRPSALASAPPPLPPPPFAPPPRAAEQVAFGVAFGGALKKHRTRLPFLNAYSSSGTVRSQFKGAFAEPSAHDNTNATHFVLSHTLPLLDSHDWSKRDAMSALDLPIVSVFTVDEDKQIAAGWNDLAKQFRGPCEALRSNPA